MQPKGDLLRLKRTITHSGRERFTQLSVLLADRSGQLIHGVRHHGGRLAGNSSVRAGRVGVVQKGITVLLHGCLFVVRGRGGP